MQNIQHKLFHYTYLYPQSYIYFKYKNFTSAKNIHFSEHQSFRCKRPCLHIENAMLCYCSEYRIGAHNLVQMMATMLHLYDVKDRAETKFKHEEGEWNRHGYFVSISMVTPIRVPRQRDHIQSAL